MLAEKKVSYILGPYNEVRGDKQAIRITEGCPHNHPYCYEPTELKVFGIPEIVRNEVLIYDMNLLCKPEALNIIKELGEKRVDGKVVHYELVCGIDFRFLTPEIAQALKASRFSNIRLAWAWFYKEKLRIKDAIQMLTKVGYKPCDIMVFMLCNWKVPYSECLKKLDLLKVWNVQVCDCYFDNQIKNIQPIYWSKPEIDDFNRRCRKHNQLVNFRMDPEVS